MSNKFQITKARLAEIIKEEYAAILEERLRPEAAPAPPPAEQQSAPVDLIKEMIKKQLQSL